MRPHFSWKLRSRSLPLGERTLVMGILNVTPDSFSDGGEFFSPDQALKRALEILDQGADIIDIGGESTRPGKRPPLPENEEHERIIPVIKSLCYERPDAVVSVDTYKAGIARAAMDAGAEIVNDVSALCWDPAMAKAAAELKSGVVLMHMRGRPEDWRHLPPISGDDLLPLVKRELSACAKFALEAGIAHESMVLDAGFGFGKTFDENYPLLARFGELHELGFPLLAGTSRKSFIGHTLASHLPGRGDETQDANAGHQTIAAKINNANNKEDRLHGTLATITAAILQGAHIIRVHDVKAALDAVKVSDKILQASAKGGVKT